MEGLCQIFSQYLWAKPDTLVGFYIQTDPHRHWGVIVLALAGWAWCEASEAAVGDQGGSMGWPSRANPAGLKMISLGDVFESAGVQSVLP